MQLLSIVKWLTRLPKALEEIEREVEDAGKKLNLTHEQLDRLKAAIDKAKKFAGNAKKVFDAATAKDSLFRKAFGDALTDAIVSAVNAGTDAVVGPLQVATEFALVRFESKGVFDIFSFAGVAHTETDGVFGMPMTVALDFAARKNQSLLGFQGHVIMERRFQLSLTLAQHEQSNGNLVPV